MFRKGHVEMGACSEMGHIEKRACAERGVFRKGLVQKGACSERILFQKGHIIMTKEETKMVQVKMLQGKKPNHSASVAPFGKSTSL